MSLAQQIEAAYPAALEKRDAEAYNSLQGSQHLGLATAGTTLQDLRVAEAARGITLATQQRQRALIQKDHFQSLLNPEGNGPLEAIELKGVSLTEGLGLLATAVGVAAGIAATVATGGAAALVLASLLVAAKVGEDVAKKQAQGINGILGGVNSIASGASTLLGQYSSFQRRAEGWQHDLDLAEQDVIISSQQNGSLGCRRQPIHLTIARLPMY